jgi:4-hydroxybenzoate polyprenyltransferase
MFWKRARYFDARNDQVRAFGVRTALRSDRGAAALREGGSSAPAWSGKFFGLWWRWWGAARPRWHSTGWCDAGIDSRNPSDPHAAPARGCLSPDFAWAFVVLTRRFLWPRRERSNPSVPAAGSAGAGGGFLYSFTKRFTSLFAPGTGILPGDRAGRARGSPCAVARPAILWLTAAVIFWTAGFDIIYSCQDYEFDSPRALQRAARCLGIAGALGWRGCSTC